MKVKFPHANGFELDAKDFLRSWVDFYSNKKSKFLFDEPIPCLASAATYNDLKEKKHDFGVDFFCRTQVPKQYADTMQATNQFFELNKKLFQSCEAINPISGRSVKAVKLSAFAKKNLGSHLLSELNSTKLTQPTVKQRNGEHEPVDLALVVNSAFGDGLIIQIDGTAILPASDPIEQTQRLLDGIEECVKSPQSNPECGILIYYLLEVLRMTEDWTAAEKTLSKATLAYKATPSIKDPKYLSSCADINNAYATILENIGKNKQAIKIFREALNISERIAPQSVDTVNSINNLANSLETEGFDEEAQGLYLKALEILTSIGELNSETAARVHNNLAILNKRNGLSSEARSHYQYALSILGKKSTDIMLRASTLFNAAKLEIELGNKKQAKQYLSKANDIARNELAPDHKIMVAIRSVLDEINS